jgi:hypothetical protein
LNVAYGTAESKSSSKMWNLDTKSAFALEPRITTANLDRADADEDVHF